MSKALLNIVIVGFVGDNCEVKLTTVSIATTAALGEPSNSCDGYQYCFHRCFLKICGVI